MQYKDYSMSQSNGKVSHFSQFADILKDMTQSSRRFDIALNFNRPDDKVYDPIDSYICLDHSIIADSSEPKTVTMKILKSRPDNGGQYLYEEDLSRKSFVDIKI